MNEVPEVPTVPEASEPVVSPAVPEPPRDYSVLMRLERRSLTLSGVRTSIALEPMFWNFFEHLAINRGTTWRALVTAALDIRHTKNTSRAAVLRLLALQFAVRDANRVHEAATTS